MKVFLSYTIYIDDACNGDEFYMMIMIMVEMMVYDDDDDEDDDDDDWYDEYIYRFIYLYISRYPKARTYSSKDGTWTLTGIT